MARSRRGAQPPAEEAGPVRYTQERLFWDVDADTVKALRQVWKDGEQLATEALPDCAVCCVLLLAAYAKRFDVELVDDYDALIERACDGKHHPDLFFISCIRILHQRGEAPTLGAFVQIGIPDLYEDLVGE